MSEEEAIKLLQRIGFSRSESLVYISLLKYGPLPARTLSDVSKVPYSKVYTVLESLSKKGFVNVIESRPRLYAAVDPDEAVPTYVRMLIADIQNTGEKLLEILNRIKSSEARIEKRSVVIIRDPLIIASKVAESIEGAKRYVKLSGPDWIIERIRDELVKAVERGVKVYILSPKNPRIPGVKRKPMNVLAGGLIVDGREVIILLKDGNSFIALYSDHPDFAFLAETYYQSLRSGSQDSLEEP